MNKKIAVFFCLSFIFSSYLFSEENQKAKDRNAVGTYALIQSQKSGGGFSFSIPVFQKNDFVIREEINLNLYFSNSPLTHTNLLTAGDKIHFGSLKTINGFIFRSYGYAKCEYGFTWNDEYKPFSQAPSILEIGGAGGFEYLYSPEKSFFIEFGGGAAVKSWGPIPLENFAAGSFKGGYVCITTGAKYYFQDEETNFYFNWTDEFKYGFRKGF